MAHDGIADDGAATPLLSSSSAKSGKPRWNMYAFACATLASMTTILMGYSTCHQTINSTMHLVVAVHVFDVMVTW
jgi:hypothetical protein